MMKVLLATDGSEHARHAASLLAHLPHNETLELTTLYVNSTPEIHGSREVVEWMKHHSESQQARAAKIFQQVEAMFEGANVQLDNLFVEGHVGTQIVEQARTRGSELIMLGAMGHSTLDRLLLGSTSDFVATHAECSVLVVRPTNLDRHAPRILWAFDDSDAARRGMEQLGQFDWGNQTHLDVVHAVALSPTYAEIPIVIDMEELRAVMVQKTEQAAAPMRKLTNNVATHVIDTLAVGESLVRFADEHATDLIVMGDTGRGLLGRFLLGSVSRYVLRHSTCSIWIAR
jgi:nucleotide-binding universal stress UspA family protein